MRLYPNKSVSKSVAEREQWLGKIKGSIFNTDSELFIQLAEIRNEMYCTYQVKMKQLRTISISRPKWFEQFCCYVDDAKTAIWLQWISLRSKTEGALQKPVDMKHCNLSEVTFFEVDNHTTYIYEYVRGCRILLTCAANANNPPQSIALQEFLSVFITASNILLSVEFRSQIIFGRTNPSKITPRIISENARET